MNDPVRIFVSYCHADAEHLGDRSLLGFLRGLEQEGAEFWVDTRIDAGDKWDDEIRSRIAQTDIALALVSQHFLDSKYCRTEVEAFLQRSRETGLVILPVILSACEWDRHSWLRETQYLPTDGDTLERNDKDPDSRKRLFLKIRAALRKQIERLQEARRAPAVPAASEPAAGKHPVANERRRVTVLQCDLTAPGESEAFNPEDIVHLLPDYRARATKIVERLDGHIAQRRDQRLLAYFGCPHVHEDDARRAVLAAREILELPKELGGGSSSLAVRIAIHTGPMIVSADADDAEPILVGDVPHVVSAVLNRMPPGRVYVTAATQHLIDKEFACTPAGIVELGNVSQPVELFVLEDGSAPETSTRRTLVARDHELEILRQRWELAREGDGQVISIRGEPGIGKSRLVHEFRAEVAKEQMTAMECRCSPYHQNTELYPIIELLRRALACADPEGEEVKDPERLKAIVRELEMPAASVVPLLSALLSLSVPPDFEPLNLSPESRRKQTLAAVLELVLRLSARKPILIIVEDLHWIDASSLSFLGLLVRSQATAPILTLLTFRQEFDPRWGQLSHLSELSLRRLASKETDALVSLLTDRRLPDDVLAEIVRRADGIPFFVEELTKMVTELNLVSADMIGVPETLTGFLIARLDRLGTAKEIAQVASVIGREFTRDLLSQIVPVEEAALTRDLERLLESEISLRRGPGDGSYMFKHVLMQQAAYESILARDARQLHGRIAELFESKFPDFAQGQPEVLAFHYTRAGLIEKAIDYWQRAAERSIRNSANSEAVAHLSKCLELLVKLPQSRERDRSEMKLRTALALPLIAIRGYAAVEVDETLTRAKELCMEIGDDAELFRLLRLFWSFQAMRGNHRKGTEDGQQMLAMAEHQDAPQLKREAHRVLGSGFLYRGRMKEAREHLESALVYYDRERDRSQVLVYGEEPGVTCLAFLSPTLWFMGEPELAWVKGQEAVALGREVGHPYSLCFALLFSSWQFIFRRDLDRLHEHVEETKCIARHQSFAALEAIGVILDGWVNAQRDPASAGLAVMSEGVKRWRSFGARVFVPTFLALIAELHAERGHVDAGLAAVEEGLTIVEATGEGLCVPELYRVKGELLSMQSPGAPAAEASLRRAREIAVVQSARSLEFRAAISLARFVSRAGNQEEARRIMEETRGWFREEDNPHDVRRADALRAELGTNASH